jgi:hypothetical protein
LSYWRGYTKPATRPVNGILDEASAENPNNNGAFEEEPNDRRLGIQLNNVSKVNHRATKQN